MNEHDRIYPTLGNHTTADDRFAESSRGSKNASIVITQRPEGAFLVLAQHTNKSHVDGAACPTLVSKFDPNLQLFEKRPDHVEATAWKRNVIFGQLGT